LVSLTQRSVPLIAWFRRHPWLVGIAILVSAVSSLTGARGLRVGADLGGHLKDHRAWSDDKDYQRWFPGTQPLLLLVPIERLNVEEVDRIRRLEEELRRLPLVRNTLSIASFAPVRNRTDAPPLWNLEHPRRFQRYVEDLRNFRAVEAFLMDSDQTTLGLLVGVEEPGDSRGRQALLVSVREATGAVYPDREVSLLGQPAIEDRLIRLVDLANRRFVPFALAGSMTILYLFLGDWPRMLLGVVSAFSPLLWLLGLMGFMGETLSTLSTLLFPLVLSVSLSTTLYVMHTASRATTGASGSPGDSLESRLAREVLPPQLLGTLTTALGFASLLLSSAPTLQRFGFWAALGTGFALAGTYVILPAGLGWCSEFSGSTRDSGGVAVMGPGRQRAGGRRSPAVLGGLIFALAIILLPGLTRLHVAVSDEGTLLDFDPVRRDLDRFQDRFGSRGFLEVCLSWPTGGVDTPERIRRLLDLEASLMDCPLVSRVTSWSDVILDLGSKISGRRISAEVSDHELSLYQDLFGDRARTRSLFISPDGRVTRLFVSLNSRDAFEIEALGEKLAQLEAQLPAGTRLFPAGPAYLSALIHHRAVYQVSLAFLVSLSVMVLIVIVAFRSLWVGWVLLIANVLPLALSFGFAGWMNWDYDAASAVVGPILLGLIVDDTLHLIHRFRISGTHPADALEDVAPAMIVTSVTLGAGFLLSALTPLALSRRFGFLGALTVLFALLSDLVLTPALLAFRGVPKRGANLEESGG